MRTRRFCRYVLIFFVPRQKILYHHDLRFGITTTLISSQQKTISLPTKSRRNPESFPYFTTTKTIQKGLQESNSASLFLLLNLWFQFVGRIFCKHIHRRSSLFIEIRDDRWLNPYAWVELAAVHVLYDALA